MEEAYAGISWSEGVYVVNAIAFEDEGKLALGLADGRVIWRLLDKPEKKLAEIQAHSGLTGLCTGFEDNQFYTIGEDGRLLRFDGTAQTEIAVFDKAWLEHITVHAEGLIALAYKKTLVLLDDKGKILGKYEDHPSAITGICFDPKGKRVAVSHYNGVSLWWVRGEAAQKPQRLNWKGSHVGVNWSENGKYILSVMQDNAIHGWRLPDYDDFAMSGYAIKPKSLSWSGGGTNGKWLASSGSPGIVCWDCSGKGPMGRPATLLGEDCPEITVKVACHPALPMVAAGTAGGTVFLAQFGDTRIVNLKTAGMNEICVLNWSASGEVLTAASENGQVNVWRFAG